MSPRRLSGWEPAEVTTFEYDDDGRLVGAVTEREPEWSSSDRESLLALLEASRVGPHGHPMSEATSPLADPSNWDREYEYVVPPPALDFAQDALNKRKQAYRDQYPDKDLSALVWRVERREI